MKFSYNWLKDYIKGKLPQAEKVAELLTLHSFEVKQLVKKGKDYILDIDVLPNRIPDCGGHFGIAKEIAAILNLKTIEPIKIQLKQGFKKKEDFQIEIEDKNICQRYTAGILSGIKVSSSPAWLRQRLENCGLQSINNIVDILNYVMLEIGQPLHAFDFDKIQDKKIFVRFAKNGEKILALDNKEYLLDKDILVIADGRGPIAIAGIKGGKETGIDQNTTKIVLEGANFEPRTIRRASKKLNLRTDASLRFEHCLDPNLTILAINRAAFLIQKLTGSKLSGEFLDIYPKKILPKKINLKLDYLKSLLGSKIPEKEIKNILERLNFQIIKSNSQEFLVEVPSQRRDISLPEDLIEEILRLWGYEKIPSIFPSGIIRFPKRNEKVFWRNFVRDILKELCFVEVYNPVFLDEKDILAFNLSRQNQRSFLELLNPLSNEQKYLRGSLIPNLLKNVKENSKFFEEKEIKIFEIGKIFKKNSSKNEIEEKEILTGLIFEKNGKKETFYHLKGIVDTILNKIGISNVWYDEYQPIPEDSLASIWHRQKRAEIKVSNQKIGFLGGISQKILDFYKIQGEIYLFDLDFEKLWQIASEEREYLPISPYPAAIRDIAILVPRNTRVGEVLNVISRSGGLMVRDVDLFDIYEGEELPEGKKNIAFHIIYQAQDHTISSEEINALHQKIVKKIEENPNWEVRK